MRRRSGSLAALKTSQDDYPSRLRSIAQETCMRQYKLDPVCSEFPFEGSLSEPDLSIRVYRPNLKKQSPKV
jgi:hypothetical protein